MKRCMPINSMTAYISRWASVSSIVGNKHQEQQHHGRKKDNRARAEECQMRHGVRIFL